jgi:hypothetical protein
MNAKSAAAGLLTDWVDEHELALALGRNPRTLQRWRARRTGPEHTLLGEKPLYHVEAVQRWLAAGGTAGAVKRPRPSRPRSSRQAQRAEAS